ncbi:MAG: acyl transferase [Cytophagales bacterium]|nr:MAG: acyl transferase [Cytophagales bacterium]
MRFTSEFKDKVFKVDKNNFSDFALELFYFQAKEIPIFKHYLELVGCSASKIKNIEEIRFLPITFFRNNIISLFPENNFYFQSSGTGANGRSRHYIKDLDYYKLNSKLIFESFYGSLKDYYILPLLPSYQENEQSSLLYMVDDFMKYSSNQHSQYFQVNDYSRIEEIMIHAFKNHKKVLMIGVTYALLELAQIVQWNYPEMIVMETGGMKGRGEELTRNQVHEILKSKFGIDQVHSEYGMTELRSQAYAYKNGQFVTPEWMRVMIRQINDPYTFASRGMSGGINIIDLANVESCAFIETQDLGRQNPDNTFEVLGRFDTSESRGCNLLHTV